MKLGDIRRDYVKAGLRRNDLSSNPITQLETWLEQAKEVELLDITAMTLATVDKSGQPSQRIVLLKQLDQRGLVFFTNLGSRKAEDIEQNEKVSAHFAWLGLERQVKIEGVASKLSKIEVAQYFLTRPRDSQLAAWASRQSHPIASRKLLMSAFTSLREKYADGEIPLPDFWGGYRIQPTKFEFWQGGSSRLHDRFEYTLRANRWKMQRLAP